MVSGREKLVEVKSNNR